MGVFVYGFYGPLPSGEYVLVVIDEYSRFPEIDITTVRPPLQKPRCRSLIASYPHLGFPSVLKQIMGHPSRLRLLTTIVGSWESSTNSLLPDTHVRMVYSGTF